MPLWINPFIWLAVFITGLTVIALWLACRANKRLEGKYG
jgi:heme exporter protein D